MHHLNSKQVCNHSTFMSNVQVSLVLNFRKTQEKDSRTHTHFTALVVGNLHTAISSRRGGNRRREVANALAHTREVHIPCDDRSSELLPGRWAVDHRRPGSRGSNRSEVAKFHLSYASTYWVGGRVVFQTSCMAFRVTEPARATEGVADLVSKTSARRK